MNDDNPNLDIELSALMCSRLCHDVISPVGAITNGLEVLEDEQDEEMRTFAYELIKKSASQASAKLKYARLAFGSAGSADAMIDLGDAHDVARGMFEDEKLVLNWNVAHEIWPKDDVKLLLNLLLIGRACIPRGGEMTASSEAGVLKIVSIGMNAALPEQTADLEAGKLDLGSYDPRNIQIYLAYRVAQAAGMSLTFALDGETTTLTATPTESRAA